MPEKLQTKERILKRLIPGSRLKENLLTQARLSALRVQYEQSASTTEIVQIPDTVCGEVRLSPGEQVPGQLELPLGLPEEVIWDYIAVPICCKDCSDPHKVHVHKDGTS